jgi:hypothetical protein
MRLSAKPWSTQMTNIDELLMALVCAQVEVFARQFARRPPFNTADFRPNSLKS